MIAFKLTITVGNIIPHVRGSNEEIMFIRRVRTHHTSISDLCPIPEQWVVSIAASALVTASSAQQQPAESYRKRPDTWLSSHLRHPRSQQRFGPSTTRKLGSLRSSSVQRVRPEKAPTL